LYVDSGAVGISSGNDGGGGKRSAHDSRRAARRPPRFRIRATTSTDRVEQDARTDGTFPLLTNTDLSPAKILEACKTQPRIEMRVARLKSVEGVTPMWLKRARRIEPLVFLCFLALLVHALLKRHLRQGMTRAGLDQLPSIPRRASVARRVPSASWTSSASLQRHEGRAGDQRVQTFRPLLDALPEQIVNLLNTRTANFTV
jgi:hypothetical protein